MVLQVGLSRFLGEAQRLRVFGVAGGPVADEPLPLPTFAIATMMMPTMMMTIIIMSTTMMMLTSECPRGDQGGKGGASKELKRPTAADRSLGHCAGQIVEGAVATTSVVFFRHRVPPSHRRAELPSSCPATLFGDPATSQS
jgi:hypothetical protein